MNASRALLLPAIGWLFTVCAGMAPGDTIKLKDGTALEGVVLEENATQVVVRVELAGGSITRQETLPRAEIAEIVRLTPEEKARQEIDREYEKLNRYQLRPSTVYRVDYYDQIITNVFLQFLRRHPGSPHEKALLDAIAQWQTERDKVAAGQVKFAGEWMEPQQAAQRAAAQQGRQPLDQAKQLAEAHRFEEAIQQLRAFGEKNADAALAAEAKKLETQMHQQWLAACQEARRLVAEELKTARAELSQAKKNESTADKLGKQTGSGNRPKMGAGSAEFLHGQSQKQLKEAESRVADLTQQQGKLDQQITEIRARLASAKGGS